MRGTKRRYSPGDHVAKISWENQPLYVGIVTQVDRDSISAHVLSSVGHIWEYTHDLIPIDSLPVHGNK